MSKRSVTLTVLAAALACLLPHGRAQADGLAEMQERVKDFTLDNGMRFLVLERHRAPTVAFAMIMKVGSVDEHNGITGVAHVFEHMAFKGSTEVGTIDAEGEAKALEMLEAAYMALRGELLKGDKADAARVAELKEAYAKAETEAGSYVVAEEFSKTYERNGGTGLNAGTSPDSTIYWIQFPSNKLELWFLMESDRFVNPVLREFYKEKDVVLEERRMRTDSQPTGRLMEEFLAAAFKAHPYGHPTIGHHTDVDRLTRAQAEEFFRTHYLPNNATVGIVGDVDAAQVKAMAERYFSAWKRGPQPPEVVTVEPPQQGEKRIQVEAEAQPILIIGWHRPDVSHPDDPVYDVIADVLSGGRSSRLHKALVKDQQNALGVGAFTGYPGRRYPHLFCVYAVPSAGHDVVELEEAIYAELEKLASEGVSESELTGVKTRVRAGLVRAMASNADLAENLVQSQALAGDWRELFRAPALVAAVTDEDVRRVAKATFTKRNRTVGWLAKPTAAKPQDEGK